MAILNTLRGNLQSDPMRVPAPAAMSTGRDDSFASALDGAAAPVEPRPAVTERAPAADVDDEIAAAAANAPANADRSERSRPEPTAARGSEPGPGANQIRDNGALPAQAERIDASRRGEPGRQTTAGKGSDSPRTHSTRAALAEPLLDEIAGHGARGPERAVAVIGSAAAPAGAGRATGDPLLRAVDGANQRGSDTARSAAVKPGYRTSAAATAQMLDQARESIFRQLLLKITDGGGEMRMRLDPPELGEVELRMVVEHGNRLTLAISTERADLAELIQRHVTELATSLAGAGLELTRADVHARGSGDAAEEPFGGDAEPGAGDDDGGTDIERPQRRGYIRADGLDFWV